MPRPFHLGWFLQGSSVQAWGEPFTGAIGRDWMVPDLFCDVAAPWNTPASTTS